MLIMKNFTLSNLQYFLKSKLNLTNKTFLFNSFKNYYSTVKNYRYLYLMQPQYIINFFCNNLYFLNAIKNEKLDKWFILKLVSLNEFIKYFDKLRAKGANF